MNPFTSLGIDGPADLIGRKFSFTVPKGNVSGLDEAREYFGLIRSGEVSTSSQAGSAHMLRIRLPLHTVLFEEPGMEGAWITRTCEELVLSGDGSWHVEIFCMIYDRLTREQCREPYSKQVPIVFRLI